MITEEEEMYLNRPYGGLFGNTVIASVVEELVADPTMDYRPKYLEEITGKSQRSIYTALKTLTKLELIENVGDVQAPIYHVKVESKKFIALSFLAYAMLDDREGSDCMDLAVREYYNEVLRERDEPQAMATMSYYKIHASTSDREMFKMSAASA